MQAAARSGRISRALRLAVAAAAVLALFHLVRPEDFRRAAGLIASVGWPLVLVLLPTLAALGLDAAGWRAILGELGYPVPWRRMLELRLSVEALVLAVPGGSLAGEAAKLALLTRRWSVPPTRAGATLALTKAYLISTDAIYLGIAGVWLALDVARGGNPGGTLPISLAFGGAGLTALVGSGLFLLLRRATVASRLADLLGRVPIARLKRWVEARRAAFADIDAAAARFFEAPAGRRLACAVPFMLEWLVEGAETLLILRLLGAPIGLGEAVVLDALGSLLRVLVFFVPAGLGIQDAATILLLRHFGVPDPLALGTAVVVVKRTKEVFWIVAGASLFVGTRDSRRQNNDRQT
jgi:uncharacterized membrane protein YbhN (UPF0104 family)